MYLRCLWFTILLAALQYPFQWGMRLVVNASGEEMRTRGLGYVLIVFFIVVVMPYLLYLVSEWTGEFVGPRINRKKMLMLEERGAYRPRGQDGQGEGDR